MEINKRETRETIGENQQNQRWFFIKIHQTDKLLAMLINNSKEGGGMREKEKEREKKNSNN